MKEPRFVIGFSWIFLGKDMGKFSDVPRKEVRAAVPHQMLAYNLSPSFNWDRCLAKDVMFLSI